MNDIYKIAFSLLKGIGIVRATKLLETTDGNTEDIFKLSKGQLKEMGKGIQNILSDTAKKEALRRAEKELKFIEKEKITPLFFTDKDYPSRLRECVDAPVVLYAKGNTNLNALHCLSVVGTRQPTQLGIDTTQTLIAQIAENFPYTLIISGMAYGIDITAHKAALENGLPTVAILGHGLQTLYPAMHKSIAQQLVKEHGALLTSYTMQSPITPKNFIERNGIVAGMGDATIVVESKIKGGAMATAYIANSYGRDVLAIPGNINQEKSQGCNKLIKTQIAALIENADDIGYSLGWENSNKKIQQQLLFDLSKEEEQIAHLLQQKGKMSIDILCNELKTKTNKILPVITQLEFKGILVAHPGKFYSLKK